MKKIHQEMQRVDKARAHAQAIKEALPPDSVIEFEPFIERCTKALDLGASAIALNDDLRMADAYLELQEINKGL